MKQSSDKSTKAFAQRMIADHTKTGKAIVPAAKAEKVKLPEALDEEHQAQLDALKAADKASFDRMCIADRLKAHETAVALFSGSSINGEKGELKTFATKALPTLKEHLSEVENLK
jgi:putative membrane protein